MTREELIAALQKAEAGSYELSREVDGWLFREHHEEWKKAPSMAYTTSIDAALTLVGDGCMWGVGTVKTVGPYAAMCWPGDTDDPREFRGATPALALCIAALKARA